MVEAQAFVAMTAVTTLVVSALRSDLLSRAELDELKTIYLRTVAHDIRGPLMTMGGFATLVEEHHDSFSVDERTDMLRRIRATGERLDKMVGELLAGHRLQGATPQPRPTDVCSLVLEAIDRVDHQGHPIERVGEPITASIDPIEVERIIENLISNAVRHTPAGTPIRVAASLEAKGLLICVDDSGPGVSDDMKQEIFKPFIQAESGGLGTGLGLSLVAQLAQRHGGRAWVEDRDGGGASFRVLLPVS